MRTYIIVTASALVLAALITEAHFGCLRKTTSHCCWSPFSPWRSTGCSTPALLTRTLPPPCQVEAAARQKGAARGPHPLDRRRQREEGTVKWFDEAKGFGFIIRADRSEIFVTSEPFAATGANVRSSMTGAR